MKSDIQTEPHIRLLDCTLRDGGHITDGRFGKNVIQNTVKCLVESNIDIIEVGFLWNSECGEDIARFRTIDDVRKILPQSEKRGGTSFCLMADYISLEDIEPCDGTIEYIRLSFKRWRLDWALETADKLMKKGYKVFINPVNNNVYSDKQYIEVLEKVNGLHPYGFSIVDTFGVMRNSDLIHRYSLVENNLLPDITIGFHLHENLGLSFSLAQEITSVAKAKRKIIIDGSLLGMGRVPGNLCIEQFAEYININYGERYHIDPLYDAIDDYIQPIKNKHPWGYSIPYALSAKYHLHRSYAEILMSEQRLKIKDIRGILSQVDMSEAEVFNETYIRDLYEKYKSVEYDDTADRERLKRVIKEYDRVLIISPGDSVRKIDLIKEVIDEKTFVISINFILQNCNIYSHAVFMTNIKRYTQISRLVNKEKKIITSNVMRDIENPDYIFSYNNASKFTDVYCDDSTLMLINILLELGIEEIKIAGFDGTADGKIKFYDGTNKSVSRLDQYRHDKVAKILSEQMRGKNVIFVTPSEYSRYM